MYANGKEVRLDAQLYYEHLAFYTALSHLFLAEEMSLVSTQTYQTLTTVIPEA